MALDERAFFSEKAEQRTERLSCPRCRRTNEYPVRWVRRTKKDRLPPGADERDRAKFAKLRDHLIRVDDEVVCKACGRKFEIPSMHSLLFVDQLEGLPRDVEDDEPPVPDQPPAAAAAPQADSPAAPAAPGGRPPDRRGPRRSSGPSRGWRG
jgi:uncharacterized protein YbaR (Trm112 family)